MLRDALSRPVELPDLRFARSWPWLRIASWLPWLCFAWLAIPELLTARGVEGGDTGVYLSMARSGWFSAYLWAGPRPVTVGILYKLLGMNWTAIAVAQWLIAIACWCALAHALSQSIRVLWLRPAAVLIVLAFSLTIPVSEWHRVLLSESVSISLWAAVLAAWLWLLQGWTRPKAAALVALTLLWVFCRDTNALLLLCVVPVLAVTGIRHGRGYWKLAGIFLLIAAASIKNADAGKRWEFPFYNSMGQRILTDGTALKYFKAHGMPVTPALLNRSGTWASSDNYYFYHAPDLQSFREWTSAHGKRTYARWTVSDPHRFITEPFREPDKLLGVLCDYPKHMGLYWYRRNGARPVLSMDNEQRVFPDSLTLLLAWSVLLLVGFALLYHYRRPAWLVPLLMLATVLPLLLLCYWGDAMEIPRHCLLAGVQWRLGLWIGSLFAADALTQIIMAKVRAGVVAGGV